MVSIVHTQLIEISLNIRSKPYYLSVGFDSKRFRVIGYLGEFTLGFLEIGVVLNL